MAKLSMYISAIIILAYQLLRQTTIILLENITMTSDDSNSKTVSYNIFVLCLYLYQVTASYIYYYYL